MQKPKRTEYETYQQYQDALEVHRKQKHIEKALAIEYGEALRKKTDIQKLGKILKDKKRLQAKLRKIKKKKRKKTAYQAISQALRKKTKEKKIKQIKRKLPPKATYFSGGYLR